MVLNESQVLGSPLFPPLGALPFSHGRCFLFENICVSGFVLESGFPDSETPPLSCLMPSVRFGRWQCPHWTGALNWDAERGYDFNPPGPQTTQMSNVRKVLRVPSLSAGLTLPIFCQGHSPIIYYINTCWVDQQSRAGPQGMGILIWVHQSHPRGEGSHLFGTDFCREDTWPHGCWGRRRARCQLRWVARRACAILGLASHQPLCRDSSKHIFLLGYLLHLRTAWRRWGFLLGFFASYPLPSLCLTVSSKRGRSVGHRETSHLMR